jgi:hypothetical protein
VVVVVVVVTEALAAKAFVKSTAVKCPVIACAAMKSFTVVKAPRPREMGLTRLRGRLFGLVGYVVTASSWAVCCS